MLFASAALAGPPALPPKWVNEGTTTIKTKGAVDSIKFGDVEFQDDGTGNLQFRENGGAWGDVGTSEGEVNPDQADAGELAALTETGLRSYSPADLLTAITTQIVTYDAGADGLVDAAAGGTGLDTHESTGVAIVTAGTWSVPATLTHEMGGLEDDVHDYSGLVKISGGSTSQATAGDVDSILPDQTDNSGKYLTTDGTNSSWATVSAGSGTLDGLSDTDLSSLAEANVLIYDGTNSWDNKAMSGDATIAATGALTIAAEAIEESMLKAVDSATDEDVLTYESTTGDFEWHSRNEIASGVTVMTLADGALVDMSGITHTGSADEGLVLPTWANVSPTSDKKFLAADGNSLKLYNGGWVTIGATAAPTDAQYLTLQADATLTQERILTAGEGIDITDAGAGSTLTVSGEDATVTNKGIASFSTDQFTVTSGAVTIKDSTSTVKGAASFSTDNFTVTSGAVTIKDGGVAPAELATADFGVFSVSSGTAALDTDTVNDTHIDWGTGANQVSLDDVTDGSSYQRVAASDVDASGHVNLLQDIDGTGAVTVTGTSQTRAKTISDAADTIAELGQAQTFAAANTFNAALTHGNADTDVLTLRGIVQGGDRTGSNDAVQIASTLATATYATGVNELYVAGDVEAGGNVYAGGYQTLTTNTSWTGGDLGGTGIAPTVTDLTITDEGQGKLLYHNGSGWEALNYGDSGKFLKTLGAGNNPVWDTVTATAGGDDDPVGQVQYRESGSITAEDAFYYTSGTNTLTINNITASGTATIAALAGVNSITATGVADMDYGSVNVTDHTFTSDGGTVILDGSVTASAGVNLGTSQALVGTTAVTIGDNGQTIAINSSDWDISTTGAMTGIGAITSDGTIAGNNVTTATQVITDNAILTVDDASAADGDIAVFTANGIEGVTDLTVSGTITADTYATSADDGDRYVAAPNSVAITATATAGNLAYTSDTLARWYLADGADWNDYLISKELVDTSAEIAGIVSDETGTGVLVLATSPTLVTPTIGVATATSVNKVAITAPATSATLTLSDGSSLITSGGHSVTLTSTAETNVTLPTTGTLATTTSNITGTAAGLSSTLAVGSGGTGATTAAAAASALGVGTEDSPQFTGIELSHESANTLTASGGTLSIEGNAVAMASAIPDRGSLSIDTDDAVTFASVAIASATFTDEDAAPSVAGQLKYDNTVTGISDGALSWYDDDAVRYLVDLDTLPSDDDYVVAYDADNDKFYMKADSTGAGGDQLVDIVATSPLLVNSTTNVDDALPGSDADITFSISATPSFTSVTASSAEINGTITLANDETIANSTDTQILFAANGGENLAIDLDTATDNEIAISSPGGATNLSLGSLNFATTGTIMGAINIVTTTDGTESPTAAQMYGTMFIADHATATSDTDYTLPSAVAGMCACFYDNGGGAGGIIIDAAAGDEIILDGAGIGAADALDSPGVAGDGANGDFICILAIDATNWITLGKSGTWVDGGAD